MAERVRESLPCEQKPPNGGFFNDTAGQPGAAGTAYALALCSVDVARADCRDCLAMATSNSSGLVKQCPGSSTVAAAYDQCLVRYSDAGFFGTADTNIVYARYGRDRIQTGQISYSGALKQGLAVLNALAASSTQRFAVSKASPYALVQCTWDLPADRCQACLDLLATNISDFMTIRVPIEQPDGGSGGGRGRRRRGLAGGVGGGVLRSRKIDQLKEYTYDELKKATGNFSKDAELGRGAFGVVYKGTLESKKVIAVKKLQRKEKVEVEQFMNEVRILSGLKHKNLVKLEGYCVHQGQEGRLCYEYLPDGNLEDRLIHGRRGAKLTWKERRHILEGICKDLQYLHNESPDDIAIMHMDLKIDNILLQVQEDRKKGGVIITPKISDFGISRNLETDKQHEYVKEVVGNWSCLPPEFMEKGKASTKVDIYSFGLIILEIVTGKSRKSSSSSSLADKPSLYGEGLIKQVREHWEKRDIEKIKDASMDTKRDDEIEKCIEIALDCVLEDPEMRPDIATIARRLNEASPTASYKTRPDQINLVVE
ncbi:hypothetical protein C2845_PM02G15520 [Panicum miliaceum]|uniref:Uncharacterized protein n=1 Tax=Panicum miliaceum TaxID=4540 RepID=A0A3L6SAZ0_PANMI|nr:hypothetical protein C2845_PM02G15520 [Panicum miliaceum]